MSRYTLTRERDGAGDSGLMCLALWVDAKTDEIQQEDDARPRIGVCMRVGSYHARTMQWQDWWQTSYIEEILEDEPQRVRFKTGNSIYVWTKDE